jgi:hypothetical protein
MKKECPQIFKEEKKIVEALQESRNQVETQDNCNSLRTCVTHRVLVMGVLVVVLLEGQASLLALHLRLQHMSCVAVKTASLQFPTGMKCSTTTTCVNSNYINTLISVHIRTMPKTNRYVATSQKQTWSNLPVVHYF